MSERIITREKLRDYQDTLMREEKSRHTLEKYMRDAEAFARYLSGREVKKEEVLAYKEQLMKQYRVKSINSMLAAVNSFLRCCGWVECCVKQIRVQTQVFCPQEKELTKQEYKRLIEAARRRKNDRLEAAIETLCATGIRVGELSCITVEAVQKGNAVVLCKGKYRQVFLPRKLQLALKGYIRKKGLRSGPVFVTRTGKAWDRSNIWKEMKRLCKEAGVLPQKVFPHNLRHLFARTYYDRNKDIAKLADILGHSNIDTTRIYIISTGKEHQRQISGLGLVI